jgi:hypothetical protein
VNRYNGDMDALQFAVVNAYMRLPEPLYAWGRVVAANYPAVSERRITLGDAHTRPTSRDLTATATELGGRALRDRLLEYVPTLASSQIRIDRFSDQMQEAFVLVDE